VSGDYPSLLSRFTIAPSRRNEEKKIIFVKQSPRGEARPKHGPRRSALIYGFYARDESSRANLAIASR